MSTFRYYEIIIFNEVYRRSHKVTSVIINGIQKKNFLKILVFIKYN